MDKVERAGGETDKRVVDLPLVWSYRRDLPAKDRPCICGNPTAQELRGQFLRIEPYQIANGVVFSLVRRRREYIWQIERRCSRADLNEISESHGERAPIVRCDGGSAL